MTREVGNTTELATKCLALAQSGEADDMVCMKRSFLMKLSS